MADSPTSGLCFGPLIFIYSKITFLEKRDKVESLGFQLASFCRQKEMKHTKRFLKRVFIGALILLIALSAFAYYNRNPVKLVDVPLTSLQEKLDVTKLDNGMTVTIKEMHTIPLTTIQFWIKTGSKNEPEQYLGIAHIFEPMWFKGTPTQPVGSFDKKVGMLGGELNAYTSMDWTLFYVTVPSDKFDDIFPYMVDLLFNPSFDEKELEKEKKVVLEEQRFQYNEPEKFTDDQFVQMLIDEHPYKNPIIGYKSTISAATREAVVNFYKTWYAPNNMNIIVVGDVNKDEILKKVKNAFEKWEPKELPKLEFPTQEPHTTPRYNSSYRDLGYTYIELGFVGPKATNKDKYAMHVLETIFAEGDSSRTEQIVKKQKNLITKGYGGFTALNDMGVFWYMAITDKDKAGAAKAELLLQLNRFKTEYVTDEELEKAKTMLRAGRVKSQEQILQVGLNIGESWVDGNTYEYLQFIDNINKVTKEDIRMAAQKYFTAYTMYELKPKL